MRKARKILSSPLKKLWAQGLRIPNGEINL